MMIAAHERKRPGAKALRSLPKSKNTDFFGSLLDRHQALERIVFSERPTRRLAFPEHSAKLVELHTYLGLRAGMACVCTYGKREWTIDAPRGTKNCCGEIEI
jgi:hypothetical protein